MTRIVSRKQITLQNIENMTVGLRRENFSHKIMGSDETIGQNIQVATVSITRTRTTNEHYNYNNEIANITG